VDPRHAQTLLSLAAFAAEQFFIFSNRREEIGTNTKVGMKKTSVGGGKKREQDWGAEGEEKARYPQPCCFALIEL